MTPTDRDHTHVFELRLRAVPPAARRAAGVATILAFLIALGAFGSGSATASPASPGTTTVLAVTPLFAAPGDPITLTAVVTGTGGNPTGGVVFSSATTLGSATLTPVPGSTTTSQATLVTSFAAGVSSLTATYQSDDFNDYFNSTSNAVLLNISSAVLHNTSTTLASSPASVTVGQAVTLTAVVAESDGGTTVPTGVVTFNEGGVLLGTGTLDATGTTQLTVSSFLPGTHVITTSYSGDIIDRSSTATITITVGSGTSPAVQTTTTVTVTPNHIVTGQPVTISAHVVQTGTATTPPGGPLVTFTANGTFVGQASLDASGNASITVPGWITGSYDIEASYVGDINDQASAGDVTLAVIASASPVTITGPAVSMTYGGAVPTLTPAYSGLLGGDTAASLTTPATCTTAATAASPVGSYPLTCSGAAGSIYTFSYVDASVTVTPATLTVTAANASMVSGQAVPPLTAAITGFKNGQTLATSGVTGSPACTTTATTSSPAGSYPITCTTGTLAAVNYGFTFVAGTLTVTAATPATTCTTKHPDPSAHCESLLADPSACQSATVTAGQTLTIVYSDENPLATGSQAPSAVLSNGTVLPVTVTAASHQPLNYVDANGGSPSSRYQSLLAFKLPSTLAPGTYSILITVHDSTGDTDQWIWQVKVGRWSGLNGGNWQSVFDKILARIGSTNW
jgi:MBG domain (YGX type)/Bacterial Ig-like domain (group 3)